VVDRNALSMPSNVRMMHTFVKRSCAHFCTGAAAGAGRHNAELSGPQRPARKDEDGTE
jgi:hypothetical protein